MAFQSFWFELCSPPLKNASMKGNSNKKKQKGSGTMTDPLVSLSKSLNERNVSYIISPKKPHFANKRGRTYGPPQKLPILHWFLKIGVLLKTYVAGGYNDGAAL